MRPVFVAAHLQEMPFGFVSGFTHIMYMYVYMYVYIYMSIQFIHIYIYICVCIYTIIAYQINSICVSVEGYPQCCDLGGLGSHSLESWTNKGHRKTVAVSERFLVKHTVIHPPE